VAEQDNQMSEYNIAVTGLNAADAPCPGISVIRCIRQPGEQNLKIIGLDYELLCSTAYADNLVDRVYQLPFPQEDEEKYLLRMAEIVEKTRIDFLIPNLDFEIPLVARLESELRDLGIRLLVPAEPTIALCKKENLPKLAQLLSVDSPYSLVFSDRRQTSSIASHFNYPLVIKAVNGEAVIVYSLEEAIVFGNRLAAQWGWPLVIQQYIKGDEYCVASLADRRQTVLGSVAMKKLLKTSNGTAWMGVTAKDDTLLKLSKKIIERLKWVGPIELEFIKEQNSQRYFLIEVNPRFPTWIELAAKAGANLALAAVKLGTRQKVESFTTYKSGILFARNTRDITCDISRLGQLATEKELIYHESKE
jgi:carbamoyl-phosphate synthase large subunit